MEEMAVSVKIGTHCPVSIVSLVGFFGNKSLKIETA